MILAVVIACLVAAATAALLIPFGTYAHALIWNRSAAIVGLAGYLLANAAAGIVGWLISRRLGWRPDNVFARGALWGGVGEAIARVRFDRIPKPEGTGDAVSVIGAVGSWILGIVDWGVDRSAKGRLGQLPDPQLAQYVSDLYRLGPAQDVNLHDAIKKVLGVSLQESIQLLADPGAAANKKIDSRSFLRSSGVKWIRDYKFGPPEIRR
ncbi:MAG: hypothetical protein ABSC51_01130 [Gaiellaceae bacterium]|jgi:hypothetical protein